MKQPADAVRIVAGGLDDPAVIALLRHHRATAVAATAAGSAHALDFAALTAPDIRFWSLWEGDRLAAVGALRRLSAAEGEVKSMHVAEGARRRGHGGAMLRHIMASARQAGLARLSLETGSWAYFDAAHALYARHGFVACPPFGDYPADPNSRFMTLSLDAAGDPG